MLFKNKRLKTVGSRVRNILLAESLYILSKNYKAMNQGILAKAMTKTLKEKKSPHNFRDFQDYQVKPLKFLIVKLDESKYLITTSDRSGGPLLAYIIKSMKSKIGF